MKKIFLFATAMTALFATSCSNEDNVTNEDNSGKTRIALSAGDDVVRTRAGFTNQTRIVARIVSDSRGGGDAKCVIANLSAAAEESTGTFSKVSYVTGNTRYWDDAYGRSSILSVYAIAIPNNYSDTEGNKLDDSEIKGATTWGTSDANDNTIKWSVETTQTADLLNKEDLTYSNNIQQTGKNGVYTWDYEAGKYPDEDPNNASQHGTDPTDGRLYFTQSAAYNAELNDGPGHFDKGQMEFKHALTRIQVNLKKGEGYTGATFAVTDMQVLGQSPSGTFDIKTAAWSNPAIATPIEMASITKGVDVDATYEAQMLPGYTFEDNITNALQLTVDGNTYYIMNKQLRKALEDKVTDNDYQTKMGTRYIFTLVVSKNKIENITATIVDWNEVTAEDVTVDNSHLTFSFYNNNNLCDDVKLYKFEQELTDIVTTDADYEAAPVSGSAYTAVAGFTKVAGKDYYTTSEYYKDNKTAYHFRSLNTISEAKLNTGKTEFTMTSGNDDYHWGAPMKLGLTAIPYSSETGYSTSIAKGIVAADKESNINLTEIHMMSQLVIKLTTPEIGGVNLTDAEVYLTQYYADGTVDMSFGKITPATMTAKSSKFTAASPATDTYVFNVIPQDLKRGDADADYIGITIKTKDNNEYYIIKKLSDIKGSAGTEVTNLQTNEGYITTWYPGHKYTYTFNIKKKEIEVITATIVKWNDVKADNTDLDLEK